MKLTKHTDYALRVLMHLALHQDQLHTIGELAAHYNISQNHLMKIVQKLSTKGFVVAARGRGGGLRLAKSSSDIRIGSVVRKMENSMELVNCEENGGCVLLPGCKLRSILNDAVLNFIKELDSYTLDDLVLDRKLLRAVG